MANQCEGFCEGQKFVNSVRESLISQNSNSASARQSILEAPTDGSRNQRGCFRRISDMFVGFCNEFKGTTAKFFDMGRRDPRKIMFAIKKALALAIVSSVIFFKEPLNGTMKYSIWALLTVVVVFEFSVGATLCKGLNRGFGTLSAGVLALGIAEMAAQYSGYEEVLIVISIFWAGFFASYAKLHHSMKPYEHGFRTLLLTFCLVMISGDTNSNFFQTAFYRLLYIVIGGLVAVLMNILVFPIWSGEDLHTLVVKNFEGVADSLEGCVDGYLESLLYEKIPSDILTYQAHDDPMYVGYRAAVQSSCPEESLLLFAKWEPPHGPFAFGYPWQNYVRLAGALRYCAFAVMALHGCILSEIQAAPEKRKIFSSELKRAGGAGARVLREVANKLKNMERLNPGDILAEVHIAAQDLQMKVDENAELLVHVKHWEERKHPKEYQHRDPIGQDPWLSRATIIDIDPVSSHVNPMTGIGSSSAIITSKWPSLQSIQEVQTAEGAGSLSLATFASLLIEFVARLENVVNSFHELSELANFKDERDQYDEGQPSCWRKLAMCFQSKS